MLQADDVDEVARLQPGEADLDPPGGLRSDHHDPASLGGALVDQQPGRPGPLDDRPGDPADCGPDTVHHGTAGEAAPANGMIARPQGRGAAGKNAPPRQASAEAASGNRCSPRAVCRTRMCGLTSRILPVTVYTKDLSAGPMPPFDAVMGERSDSSDRPSTAALSRGRRAKRAGLAKSVTSSPQRGMSAKCRTCPPWDCIEHNADPAWCEQLRQALRTPLSTRPHRYIPGG